MDNSVIVHEMTHGISNRMTGGGTVRCLQGLESKGMGEGWSDMMAEYDRWATLSKPVLNLLSQLDGANVLFCVRFLRWQICHE